MRAGAPGAPAATAPTPVSDRERPALPNIELSFAAKPKPYIYDGGNDGHLQITACALPRCSTPPAPHGHRHRGAHGGVAGAYGVSSIGAWHDPSRVAARSGQPSPARHVQDVSPIGKRAVSMSESGKTLGVRDADLSSPKPPRGSQSSCGSRWHRDHGPTAGDHIVDRREKRWARPCAGMSAGGHPVGGHGDAPTRLVRARTRRQGT